MDLWSLAKNDLAGYFSKSSHRNRLKHLVSDEDFSYTVTLDSNKVIPIFVDGYLANIVT
jgi:phosphosulfolactate phosphohydrolase-like enzyme